MAGLPRDEVIGKKKIYELYTPDGVSKFRQNLSAFVEQGTISDLEFDIIRKDGTTFPILLMARRYATGTAIL